MRYEQTIWVVGCEPGAEQILLTALNKAGFNTKSAKYTDTVCADQSPACVLIHFENADTERALRFMAQPGLLRARRVIIIDPNDPKARQFCADADIDDMILKPIHLREMITRLSFDLEREQTALKREMTLSDAQGLVQKVQTLSDSAFSGVLVLEGHNREAKIYFEHGAVVGVQFGKKTQKSAAGALWRIFPAAHRAVAGVAMPPSLALVPFTVNIEQFNLQISKTAAFFNDNFLDTSGLSSIFRVNGAIYDQRYDSLPHQVRRILQLFDGIRSLESLFDVLELDEILLIQIIRRLIDENLIVECQLQENTGISFDDWILGTPQTKPKRSTQSNPIQPSKSHTSQLREDLGSVTKYLAELKALEEQLADKPEDHEVTKTAKREITRRQATSEVCVRSRIHRDPAKTRQGFSEAELRDLLHEMPKPSTKVTEPLPFDREFVERRMQKAGISVITADTKIKANRYYSDAFLNQEAKEDEAKALKQQEEDEALIEISVDTTELELETAEAELDAARQWFKDELRTRSGAFKAPSAEAIKAAEKAQKESEESTTLVSPLAEEKQKAARADRTRSKKATSNTKSQSWAIEQYQRRHGKELSPDVWKAQTMARLDAEADEKNRKLTRLLTIGLIIIILCIIIILVSRGCKSDSGQTQIPAGHANTAQTIESPQNTVQTADTAPIPKKTTIAASPTAALPQPETIAETADNLPASAHHPPKAAQPENIQPANDPQDSGKPKSKSPKSAQRTQQNDPSSAFWPEKRDRSVSNHPIKKSFDAQFQAVHTAMNVKDWDGAERLLQPLLSEYPDKPIVFIAAGRIAAHQGKASQAVEYFVKVEKSHGQKAAYWKERAKLHRQAGQMTEANAALDKAIEIVGPTSPEGQALARQKSQRYNTPSK
ncbi:MAG: hypothetical protein J6S69_04490 [Proteobacteria bacterium]|nr:hypothetical protein [Pseudomonadota bacterium]